MPTIFGWMWLMRCGLWGFLVRRGLTRGITGVFEERFSRPRSLTRSRTRRLKGRADSARVNSCPSGGGNGKEIAGFCGRKGWAVGAGGVHRGSSRSKDALRMTARTNNDEEQEQQRRNTEILAAPE